VRLPKMPYRAFDLQRIRILLGPRIAQLSNPSSPKKTVEAALGEGPDAHALSALRSLRTKMVVLGSQQRSVTRPHAFEHLGRRRPNSGVDLVQADVRFRQVIGGTFSRSSFPLFRSAP